MSETSAVSAAVEAGTASADASSNVSLIASFCIVSRLILPFLALPLPGNRQQNAQLAVAGLGETCRRLHDELIDKQERHAGLDIVEQLLQARLVDLATGNDAEKSCLGLRALLGTLQVDLGRQHLAAEPCHGRGYALQQVRAGDSDRFALQKRRTGRRGDARPLPADGGGTAAFELLQHRT